MIVGELILIVNIFILRKGVQEKRLSGDKGNPRYSTLGEQSLRQEGAGSGCLWPSLCAGGRASELHLLQRSGFPLGEASPPPPPYYHWGQLLTWGGQKGEPVADETWVKSQGIQVPDAHLHLPPGAGRLRGITSSDLYL